MKISPIRTVMKIESAHSLTPPVQPMTFPFLSIAYRERKKVHTMGFVMRAMIKAGEKIKAISEGQDAAMIRKVVANITNTHVSLFLRPPNRYLRKCTEKLLNSAEMAQGHTLDIKKIMMRKIIMLKCNLISILSLHYNEFSGLPLE
jgi:hypothetical protein